MYKGSAPFRGGRAFSRFANTLWEQRAVCRGSLLFCAHPVRTGRCGRGDGEPIPKDAAALPRKFSMRK